ncbi:hypothetical protein CL628_02355 [bacterium]|nr:hypothetical protein [bacterium]
MIREVTSREAWDEFVLAQAPNTFLHTWEWGQSQQADGEGLQYLGIFSDAGEQLAAALVLTIHAKRGIHYLIPHGPTMAAGVDPAEVLAELIAYLQPLAAADGALALRVAPLLESTDASQAVFKELGFKPAPLHVHAELTWVLDIPQSDDALLDGMRKTTRHAVKKAMNDGVATSIIPASEILDRFWPLYEGTGSRHGFVLYPRELIAEQLTQFADNDRVFGAVAQHGGKDVAAAIVFQYGQTCFYYHGASIQVERMSPTQLLQFEAIREARRRGATTYNFWGIAPDDQPNHPFAGITVFKKGFGGHAIDYMHAQDLPLAFGYKRLWLIEQWRRWRRGF